MRYTYTYGRNAAANTVETGDNMPKRFELQWDGETPETVDLGEFAVDNDLEPEVLNAIGEMAVGDEMPFGGGAAPLATLRRVS